MNHLKIKGNVKKLFNARFERKRLQEVEKEQTKEISNYMFCNGLKEIEILLDDDEQLCMEPVLLKAVRSTSKTVEFNSEKLKERLDKKLYKQIVKTEYQIIDMEGLIEYLRECGVSPKRFKKHIQKREVIDKGEFNKLYDFGDISLDDVKGCYKIKESNPSIRLTELGGHES